MYSGITSYRQQQQRRGKCVKNPYNSGLECYCKKMLYLRLESRCDGAKKKSKEI